MSGPGEGKIKLGKADVYVHIKGKSGARITHIDIELDILNEIIKEGESSYVGGKKGGVFIGLKKEFAWRQKKAAQYGSNFVRGMDKLARRAGFEFKKDYLKGLI